MIKFLVILCVVFAGRISAADDGIENVLSATFHVMGGPSGATGFAVRTTDGVFLVTAKHFLEQAGDDARLSLRQESAPGIYVKREVAVRLKDAGKVLWRSNPKVDVGILKFDVPSDVALKPFELSQLADEKTFQAKRVRVAMEVWIPGYPVNLEANAGGWAVLRRGVIASYPLVPLAATPTFLVNANTFSGDSGAPVVAHAAATSEKSEGMLPLVTGLVQGMHRQTDHIVTTLEDRTTHFPIALAIVVPAPFIRELLETPAP